MKCIMDRKEGAELYIPPSFWVRAAGHTHLEEKSSAHRDEGNLQLDCKGVQREVEWEGNCEQNPGFNRKRELFIEVVG